ncbi:GMC oxidoreductase [Bradyrhizobium sp. C-145]|uniref:GMC oxidoreductase n=1 Tax=Bradyrhizobium sp. C-145 TaxID=574727 RepID=UPI00201B66E4|nr:GMC oxidoreductase [Bradyrhizobium sp. C-145]UQR61517.1 GMC oxidoreductase [Bradyrhizobium sp. C-145]
MSHPFPTFSIATIHLRPECRGTVRLKSPDPLAQAEIRFNFVRGQYDNQAILASIRIARKIVNQAALKDLIIDEIVPGAAISNEEQLVDDVRGRGRAILHPVGSCAMGRGTNAVVDPRLRMHGIIGLRVVDASIMPSNVAGNTNAPTIMIAEKASDMILAESNSLSTHGNLTLARNLEPWARIEWETRERSRWWRLNRDGDRPSSQRGWRVQSPTHQTGGFSELCGILGDEVIRRRGLSALG